MAKKTKDYQPPLCAFCDNISNTKEHHWPQWLDDVLPKRTPHDKSINFRGSVKKIGNENFSINPLVLLKKGAPHRARAKSVCKRCNGGWMGIIQDQAKPILIDMILGNKGVITEQEQELIRRWMTMTDMTAEFTHRPSLTTTREQHLQFKETLEPPTGWMIFAGRYKGEQWKTRFCHYAFNTKENQPYDIHTTLFVVGELLFFVLAVYETTFPKDEFVETMQQGYPVVPIWPSVNKPIDWHGLPFFNDSDANQLAALMTVDLREIKCEVNLYGFV